MSIPAPHYRISSFCGTGGCVAVAALPDGSVALRDSKDEALSPHVFTPEEWDAFVAGVRNGEFDRSALTT